MDAAFFVGLGFLLFVMLLGYLGVFVIAVLGNATVILPVPGLAVVFAGGGVLNPLVVGLIAGVGEPLGELTGYLAGYGGSVVAENREWYERIRRWMERRGFVTLLVLSAVPNPLFDLAGMAAGDADAATVHRLPEAVHRGNAQHAEGDGN